MDVAEVFGRSRRAVARVLCPDIGQAGSAFVIDPRGYLLTNSHVVTQMKLSGGAIQFDHSSTVLVELLGHTYSATIISSITDDRPIVYDYAIIKIDPNAELPYLAVEKAQPSYVGEPVLCVGYPLDISDSVVTKGIVSAVLARPSHVNTLHQMHTVLTDAVIQFGNSGGPMILEANGAAIAVNTLQHELRDNLRLQAVALAHRHPELEPLVNYILKYTFVGLNHAVSVEHAMQDDAWPN